VPKQLVRRASKKRIFSNWTLFCPLDKTWT
jgi:hypothetical protein